MHSQVPCGSRWAGVLALAGALVGGPAAAQRLPAPRFETAPRLQRVAFHPTSSAAPGTPSVSPESGHASTGRLVLGAVIGGALAGGTGAALFTISDPDGGLAIVGTAMGFTLLEPIGVGVGTHVANRARGSLGLDLLVAAGTLVLGGGLVLAGWSGNNRDVYRGLAFAAIPAQIAATVAMERAMAPRARPGPAPEEPRPPATTADTAGVPASVRAPATPADPR